MGGSGSQLPSTGPSPSGKLRSEVESGSRRALCCLCVSVCVSHCPRASAGQGSNFAAAIIHHHHVSNKRFSTAERLWKHISPQGVNANLPSPDKAHTALRFNPFSLVTYIHTYIHYQLCVYHRLPQWAWSIPMCTLPASCTQCSPEGCYSQIQTWNGPPGSGIEPTARPRLLLSLRQGRPSRAKHSWESVDIWTEAFHAGLWAH